LKLQQERAEQLLNQKPGRGSPLSKNVLRISAVLAEREEKPHSNVLIFFICFDGKKIKLIRKKSNRQITELLS